MRITRRVRNVLRSSGKQISKKPDKKVFTFFKRNVAREERAVLKRGGRKFKFAVITLNIKKNLKKFKL